MLENLPVLTGCGIFSSRSHFPHQQKTAPRTVANYELELFLEDGGVSYINGEAHPIRAGMVLLAQPGDTRCSELHFKALFLHFRFHDRPLQQRLSGCRCVLQPADPQPLYRQMLALCDKYYTESPENELATAAGILSCLRLLLQEQQYRRVPLDPLVRTAREYMEHHYADRLSLQTIADACHLSGVYFHRRYTALTGETPHTYLQRRRLEAARSLLRTTDLPLAEVAQACGFSSQAYFSQRFREAEDCTPSQYRQRISHPDNRDRSAE